MKTHDMHCHTTYSDGNLTPEQLVEIADSNELGLIGICDHAFSRKLPEQYNVNNIEKYISSLKELKRSSAVEIKIGLEVDVSTEYGIHPFELPEVVNELDYILFEYVNTKSEHWGTVNGRDISTIVVMREQLNIPVGLAHNDLQKNFDGKETEIAKILAENEIFIELCQSEFNPGIGAGRNSRAFEDYYRHFSIKLINELVQNEVRVVAGTDAHKGQNLGYPQKVCEFIEENNLKYHQIVL